MSQVTRTPEEEEDLLDILAYLTRHSTSTVARVSAEIDRECQLLARFPLMGTISDNLSPGSYGSLKTGGG